MYYGGCKHSPLKCTFCRSVCKRLTCSIKDDQRLRRAGYTYILDCSCSLMCVLSMDLRYTSRSDGKSTLFELHNITDSAFASWDVGSDFIQREGLQLGRQDGSVLQR